MYYKSFCKCHNVSPVQQYYNDNNNKKNIGMEPVVVFHAYNPSYLRGGDWKACELRTARARSLGDPISTNKELGTVAHACHSSYLGGINRRTAA
jgi:hypothetical protein